jgi:hypothetical protein
LITTFKRLKTTRLRSVQRLDFMARSQGVYPQNCLNEKGLISMKEVKNGRFSAKKIGESTIEISGLRVWRGKSHPNEIFLKLHDEKPTSVHKDAKSKRGNPHLFKMLDELMNELEVFGAAANEE